MSTAIRYEPPAVTKQAAIGIYDMNGKELVKLPGDKRGRIAVEGRELTPGMYLYTLVVDGRYFDSKKMVLTSN